MEMNLVADVIGTNFASQLVTKLGGYEMKAVFVTVVLSILSAVVGIFAATELHDLSASTISSTDKTSSQSSQKIQQWVNH